jgi:hypothetical protein
MSTLVGKSETKRPHGRPVCRCDGLFMHLKEVQNGRVRN